MCESERRKSNVPLSALLVVGMLQIPSSLSDALALVAWNLPLISKDAEERAMLPSLFRIVVNSFKSLTELILSNLLFNSPFLSNSLSATLAIP